MSKVRTAFFCQNCGAQTSKWIGYCPACKQWNTYVEEIIEKSSSASGGITGTSAGKKPSLISDISIQIHERILTGNNEFDRVLGGGIVPGSVILIGGEPGIGKSTLMLQLALQLDKRKVIYVSGEESEQQIKMRAERIRSTNGKPASPDQCYLLTETTLDDIFQHLKTLSPAIVMIDSIQTMRSSVIDSSAGSVSQLRECTAELVQFAKKNHVPVFLVGHITKDGTLAGPKVLEHMVDVVLQFEGDRNYLYRLLRTLKNRFGSASELGIYEMAASGLREVANPSEMLVSPREEPVSGTAVCVMMEGVRPMLIETQALVSSAVYGTPQRTTTGFDIRRLNMLLAVLEKRCGFRIGSKDVFLNIAGGIKVEDPAIDLGVISAILSSKEDSPVNIKTCFAAEVGLTGEIRPVNLIEQRIAEADKLGYDHIFISKNQVKSISRKNFRISVVALNKVEEVYMKLFGSK
ncbi:MAG: DNA repair protein RadA [Bacteroidetes bacterium]|nr:DNA repair protein RadA [Bacteroidota bacterium]